MFYLQIRVRRIGANTKFSFYCIQQYITRLCMRHTTKLLILRCQGSAVFIFCVDVIVEVLSCGQYMSIIPSRYLTYICIISTVGVVLNQLFQLWNFNRLISRIVLVTFFFSKVVLFAFAGAAIALIKSNGLHSTYLRSHKYIEYLFREYYFHGCR